MAKARNWAIVVGINKYQNIGQLDYANRDAEAIAAFFRSAQFDRVFCFADELVIEKLDNQQSTQPRSSDLVDFLHDRFTTTDSLGNKEPPLKPGDNIWFFFAGHGKRINNRDCLLPIDYNPRLDNHHERAIAVEFVREALLRSGADNVILLLDACRTEGDRAGDDGIGGDPQPGAITIFSCERNKKAYKIDELKHGAFTAALLEGLEMPKGSENCATVQRLDRHLRDRVPQLCEQYHKPTQKPNTTVDPGQKWYFLILPKVATEQDIATLKNEAQEAELEDKLTIAEQLWIRYIAATQGEDVKALQAYARVLEKQKNQRSHPLNSQPNLELLPTPQSWGNRSQSPQNWGFGGQPDLENQIELSYPTFSFEIITVDATGWETQRKPGTAKYFSEDLGNGTIVDMVQIPGGSFMMGANQGDEGANGDEYPQHSVTVPEFWMGKFAVTQAQWQAVANLAKVKMDLEPDPSYFKGAKRPVERVSWDAAIEFCDRLSRKTKKTYRLPSEAEWEYACRAGTLTPFHLGETITENLANFDGNYKYAKAWEGKYRKRTIDVGSFPPNAFGLYDMHGNIWEWCADTWHGTYDRASNDGSAWIDNKSSTRLGRGGSWYDNPYCCRSADRSCYDPAHRSPKLGFRLVCLPS